MPKSPEFQQISDLIYYAANALKNLAGKQDLLWDEWDYRVELLTYESATQLYSDVDSLAPALPNVEMVCLRYGDKNSVFPINEVAQIAHDLLQVIQKSLESRGELAAPDNEAAAQMWKVYDEQMKELLEISHEQNYE